MNAVEIEEAISALAEQPFDAAEFPFAFLEAFGNKPTTIKRLRKGASNASDIDGGVLQRNNIHIAVASIGETAQTLAALKVSPATAKAKAKFILATDGQEFHAEDLSSGEIVVCDYPDFPDHFGFFLALAGISTVRQIRESAFDIKATGRLNRLYVELLRHNPEWGTAERRQDMNHFMARLIFLFFAEDTDILNGNDLFTATIDQMSERDGSNMHAVIGELFRAMNTPIRDRASAKLPRWADVFPYVNGGLFSGSTDVPRFSKIARSYLLHIGTLDWKKINPDIFGSMIQAVADDEERGALGMHYTSVPNILKVLNPLFLDDLRETLEEAGDNGRKLLNLRNRMAKIRVFDPACGSGNFLVIAYKQMRAIEAEINKRRGETDRTSDIPLTNFRGIELRDFPAEIARLALIIAEYQCDVTYRGQKEALADFLPLDAMNWITCGNALRLDWASLMDVDGGGVKFHSDDLFHTPLDQAQINFDHRDGELFICGNPQFKGARKQSKPQKEDLSLIFNGHKDYKDCDYVVGWFLKAAELLKNTEAKFAFVSTSSISQGEQVAHLWSRIYGQGLHINFAHQGFKWKNNAANNAVVHCVIVGVSRERPALCRLFDGDTVRQVQSISPYLIAGDETFVTTRDEPLSTEIGSMVSGSMPRDGGNLLLSLEEARELMSQKPRASELLRGLVGSQELVNTRNRKCLWIADEQFANAEKIPEIRRRIDAVRHFRSDSSAKTTRGYASIPHKFAQRAHIDGLCLSVAKTSSELREYIPADIFDKETVISDAAFAIYAPSIWEFAIVVSRLHLMWVGTVCGKLETRYRYSSTLGWNTFPVPKLTEKNKEDLTRCAEVILLAREAHFPATIAELYDPEKMPADLRAAHDRNDEVLERIYIGRRFKNDTERLEKLFELYTKMTTKADAA
ncbi:class I SAM-dependent DNA methyltransferase [Oceaniradius stylonematis]|uniref:class I SAM-dependent DNA methyltransferase n=1 Tax=Oceaniradius stylonematis TaxID=2184161 RepID=UPI00273E060D|nr:DNA methyltransferase [Oceaniradius stylonematis]